MSYHILIVDDEPIVRNGLRNFDWETYGFECVGACENGREALDWLSRNAADVVLTDIKMPGIDGVELSGLIRERYPDLLVILLTGYNEFAYAQQAIKTGVFDYLLKPAEDSDFEEVLAKCAHTLQEREMSKQMLSVLSHHFLLRNGLRESHLSEAARELVRRPALRREGPFRLVLVSSELEHPDPDACRRLERRNFARISNREWILLCPGEEIGTLQQWLADEEEPLNAGVSLLHDSDEEVPEAFAEANKALQLKFLNPEARLFQYADRHNASHDWEPVAAVIKKMMLVSNRINALNAGKIEEYLSDIMQELESRQIAEPHIRQLLLYLILSIESELAKASLLPDDQWTVAKEEWTALIRNADRFEGIKSVLAERMAQSIQALHDANTRVKDSAKLEEALAYIHVHYAGVLSLDLIADELQMHPNFFSKWFKDNKGINFIDYVTQYRIDKAKELLEHSELKAGEIAERTGIPDARYFGQVFKKHVGLTPTEYRALFK
ncbi:DNA-binding response regulator [Paenibacillus agaridevorans]|uniref:DNA-binding response regulator n=1 Tax=Paenibacillus agaridevorans TaxID=171404 RepID=A0A2R5EZQ2_9BACL|nr:response regulator [Paenibacillus agaridevorans]GBG10568.1 DNA-binding response regulator [Paenibacillus agaridevorans]